MKFRSYKVGVLDRLLGDRAVRRGEKVCKNPKQPFLVSLHFNAPHWPWEAPVDDGSRSAAEDGSGGRAISTGVHKDLQRMIEDMDRKLAGSSGLWNATWLTENTIIIFTSDKEGSACRYLAFHRTRKRNCWKGVADAGLDLMACTHPEGRTTDQVSIRWMDADVARRR